MNSPATSQSPEPDKWASWNTINNKSRADEYLRETFGIVLHIGSTKEEIDRAVRIYKSAW